MRGNTWVGGGWLTEQGAAGGATEESILAMLHLRWLLGVQVGYNSGEAALLQLCFFKKFWNTLYSTFSHGGLNLFDF